MTPSKKNGCNKTPPRGEETEKQAKVEKRRRGDHAQKRFRCATCKYIRTRLNGYVDGLKLTVDDDTA